jgi:hypothetical protein
VGGEQRGEGLVFVLSKDWEREHWYAVTIKGGERHRRWRRVLLESETRKFSITFLFRDSRLFTNRFCILVCMKARAWCMFRIKYSFLWKEQNNTVKPTTKQCKRSQQSEVQKDTISPYPFITIQMLNRMVGPHTDNRRDELFQLEAP